MLTRAPLLSRAIVQQFARNGKLLSGATRQTKQLQVQSIRFSGDWTYRTARTLQSHSLAKRAVVQLCGGCKWFLPMIHTVSMRSILDLVLILHEMEKIRWICILTCSYVVVDSLASVLGMGTHCRWIRISRHIEVDGRRARYSTRWWRISKPTFSIYLNGRMMCARATDCKQYKI